MKPWLFTGFFSILGVISITFLSRGSSEALAPHVLFYSVLLLNSFFSIRMFSRIQPKVISQVVIDVILFLTYAALAISIGYPLAFAFSALSIFVVASFKYVFMLEVVSGDVILKQKILIDLTGTALCAAALGGTLLGYSFQSAWILAATFLIANVYLLFIRPMYTMR